MGEDFNEETWDGKKCNLCGNDCWKNRMKLAIEIAKEFNREFSMRELYKDLAKKHPPARKTEKRKTPWATFYRDLYENPNFVKVDRGVFKLIENPQIDNIIKSKKHNELVQFEMNVRKLKMLKEAGLITEEEYIKKGKEFLELIKIKQDVPIEKQYSESLGINESKENNQTIEDDYKIDNKDEAKQMREQVRDDFINFLKYEKNIDVTKIKGCCLYEMNGLKMNIKYDRKKNKYNKFWFNISTYYLSGIKRRKVDFFIFICGEYEDFFVIPNIKMEELVKNASIDSRTKNRNFNIQIKKDVCYFLPSDKKGTKVEISEYYKNLKPIIEI